MSNTNTNRFGIDYNAVINAEYAALKKTSKAYLVGEYERRHRISDVREFSKGDLIIEVLRDKFGTKRIVAALNA